MAAKLSVLLLVALVGCRAVLGIEEFDEPSSGGAAGSASSSGGAAGSTSSAGSTGDAGMATSHAGDSGQGAGSAGGESGGGSECSGEGTPCGGISSPPGLCRAGQCDSDSCFIAGEWFFEGARDPANDCNYCSPIDTLIGWSARPEAASCKSGNVDGTCRGGACCTGCWDGANCMGGTGTGACGAAGGSCQDCLSSGSQGNCTDNADTGCPTMHYFVPYACNAGSCGYGNAECCANGCNGAGCLP